VIRVSFMLSSAMACFAGLLVGPVTLVSATMGTVLGVKAYAVSIIGGLESSYGVLVGGALLGLSESLTARYISTGYRDIPGFIILILVLLFRPSGLFGRTTVQKF
jgi:branched-chain amino acid transport system permease protein